MRWRTVRRRSSTVTWGKQKMGRVVASGFWLAGSKLTSAVPRGHVVIVVSRAESIGQRRRAQRNAGAVSDTGDVHLVLAAGDVLGRDRGRCTAVQILHVAQTDLGWNSEQKLRAGRSWTTIG